MSTSIDIFGGLQLPAYATKQQGVATLGDTFGSGMSVNRITLKNGLFRMIKGGQEVGQTAGPITVVIEAFSPYLSRSFYAGAYNPSAESKGPDCYSEDGVTPSLRSTMPQASACAMCPQNVKAVGTGRKACKMFKRIAVTMHGDPALTLYQMDAASLSVFGDDNQTAKLFNLRSYAQTIDSRGVDIRAVVTNISVDSNASVSKMLFTPVGFLTPLEHQARKDTVDPELLSSYVSIELAGATPVAQASGVPGSALPAGAHTAAINPAPNPQGSLPVQTQQAAQPVQAQGSFAQQAAPASNGFNVGTPQVNVAQATPVVTQAAPVVTQAVQADLPLSAEAVIDVDSLLSSMV